MTDPNWYLILEEIYEADGRVHIWSEYEDLAENHPLFSETGLTNDELFDAMNYLEDANLIQQGSEGYALTSDGFRAVFERRESETQRGLNRGLVYLTTILALSAIVQTAVGITTSPNAGDALYGLLGLETVVFAGIYLEMWRRGLLDFDD